MYDYLWLIIWICDKLDKFQSFLIWEIVRKDYILYTRSMSIDSWIDLEEFITNDGNIDQVQGVHRVKEWLSVEELE